ncbi:MAG: biopolymer transporter ExbD [Proteobacteria bacterium]|nr:biopolymer transporter ExbD [Pseudomonadota bacterium]MBU1585224.1 biopolymer transporter ExbD [Pseudomonadota bacterium]MBU2431873.1 biopolymer transporter ExbD [Pseudomonadota bacterium]MBU2454537.1 biopolymer transporter ExbD [Pseudomonadota bacterium]MBU2629114.1 biopolymer transporter ExbD [Pseudomonadota bacterium]
MLNITSARRANSKNLELNIAPLIDMVFILLIFFLVTTSFVKETGVDISRPTAATAVSKARATILIGVTKDNTIHIDQRAVDIRAVRANVERALAENPEGSVVIVADKQSLTGLVINVMDACKLAGAQNVAIAASLDQGE